MIAAVCGRLGEAEEALACLPWCVGELVTIPYATLVWLTHL